MPRINQLTTRTPAGADLLPFDKDIGGGSFLTGKATFREVMEGTRGLDTFATRAAFVTANAATPGLGLSDGQVVVAGGYEYRRSGASTAISDLLGWVPNGWGFFEQWGAVGDGAASDSAAMQAAFNSGWNFFKGTPGAVYKLTATVSMPNNVSADFNGACVRRGFYGGWTLQTAAALTTWDTQDVSIRNLWIDDDGTLASRGNGLLLVGDRITLRGYKNTFTAPGDGVMGAWACYASGVDISLSGLNIDNSAGGLFADGVHLGYVEDFVMTDFNIHAGDDAFALFAPRVDFTFGGKNQRAKNVSVSGGVLSSTDANGIRLGNWGAASGVTPRSDFAFENVNIDAVFGDCAVAAIQLFDDRAGAEIAQKSTDINIKARILKDANIVRLISVNGNPNIESAANLAQRNFGNVRIEVDGAGSDTAQGNLIRAGGFDRLTISGALEFDNASTVSVTHCNFFSGGTLILDGLVTKGRTTGTFCNFKWIEDIELVDVQHLVDGTSEFQTFVVTITTEVGTSFRMRGGRVTETARTIVISGTGRLKDFIVGGTQLEGTNNFPLAATFASVTWDAGGIFSFNPARGLIQTVANLPPAAVPVVEGHRAFVTDANATTFASIVAAGGANKVPVYRDGTAWRIG